MLVSGIKNMKEISQLSSGMAEPSGRPQSGQHVNSYLCLSFVHRPREEQKPAHHGARKRRAQSQNHIPCLLSEKVLDR
jgi:hypothetical protein